MKGFSIIMPIDQGREELFSKTMEKYAELGIPKNTEFILVSRNCSFDIYDKSIDFKIINYKFEGEYFNPAMALNLGVKHAKYDNIIITCPEVIPLTNVLKQLSSSKRDNIVCQVFDQKPDGSRSISLVNTNFRSNTPGMYFLACFKKEDIECINGWDEEFMKGYAWEDCDFGDRFVRAGLKFKVKDEIQAEHQYHPRESSTSEGYYINAKKYKDNNDNKIFRCENGLTKKNN